MSLSKIIRTKLHSLADLNRLDQRCQANVKAESPIVSLTSTPKRIGNIKPTIASLLKQRLPPREIHVSLGADFFLKANADVPAFLLGLTTVKVFLEKKDYGPATKFLYILKRLPPEELIVVVDDDMYYPDTLLEGLVAADARHGGLASLCLNGLRVPRSLQSREREPDNAIQTGEKRVAIVEGCGGYTLRPAFFKTDLFDIQGAPQRAFFDDDFWVSGHLSRNGIEKFQIAIRQKRKSLVNTIEPAIGGDRETLQSAMMHYFRHDWKLEEISD